MSDRQEFFVRLALVILCMALGLWTAFAGMASVDAVMGR